MEGELKHWNEDKGFGFISSNDAEDIFIHISALKKMKRRPVVGDRIMFQIHTDNNGKKRAINASISGVAAVDLSTSKKNNKPNTKTNPKKLWFSAILILAVAVGFYKSVYKPEFLVKSKTHVIQYKTPSKLTSTDISSRRDNFSCEGKKYCSEMNSCKEAMFYQQNCPGTKMDGDNDGIPCESQWCN